MTVSKVCALFALIAPLIVPGCVKQLAAQALPHPTSAAAPPPYNIVPYDEDWSFLQDSTMRSSRLDRIKYLQIGHTASSYLSFGGELRGAYERILNDNWSKQPVATKSFGLERFLLHADIHLNAHVRTFLELQSGLEQGLPDGPRPNDEKRLDFLNAFLDVHPSSERSPVLRIGKQELQLGSGRLISVREGPNVRQGFYGFRVDQPIRQWHLTGIAVRPAVDRAGFFDGAPQSTTELWGLVGSRTWNRTESNTVNLSYFGLDRKLATYNRGSGHEVRQTFSANYVLNPPKQSDRLTALHFDVEGVLQLGSFGNQAIRAWTLASESGILFPRLPLTPQVGLRADIASGDHGGTTSLGSFNPLFPDGSYFGVFTDTGPGPVNFRDVHPQMTLHLTHALAVTPDWIFWWRQRLEDGVYGVPGMLLVPSGSSRARYVGNRPGAVAFWQIDRHTYMQLSYGVFFAGPFLKDSGHGQNLNFLNCQIGYKF